MINQRSSKRFKKIVKNISNDEIAELTLDLVRIPSPTGEELEVSRLYAKILEEAGLEVRLDYVEKDRPNVIARIPGQGNGPNLMFGGHLDTIPIGRCVRPKIEGGRVYGRGSCDMKGSLSTIAQTAKAIVSSEVKLRGDVLVVGWVGHEAPTGHGIGPKVVAKKIREKEIMADAAVITEGPMESVDIAQGGMAIFTIFVTGPKISVHTMTAPLRANPVLWTAELVKELQRVDEKLNTTDWHPLIAQRPCLQLGIIRGGDFYNRLPTSVEVVGTIRWDPDEDFCVVTKRLESRLDRLRQRIWHKYNHSVNFSLNMHLVRDSCEVPKDEDIVQKVQSAVKMVRGKDVIVSGSRGVGDLPIIYKEGGIPAVAYGPFPPTGLTAHSDNESISIENLVTVSKVYLALALDFCGVS